jgi:quercetin dioxygenase-like cupin family protein
VLVVVTVSGMVENRDGDRYVLRHGDIVWAAPGEERWHGAVPDSFVAHTAISLGVTQWGEEVGADRSEEGFKNERND